MLTMTDMFCGAGGSSTGAVQVPGIRVRMAANHWKLACDTHNTNHPETDHDCADLSQVDPRRYPRTDILWASPECTNHSIAKGVRRNADSTPDLFDEVLPDEAAQRSRATMWDVVRFAEHHRYRAIIVENVVDAADWDLWPAWLSAMTALGYEHRAVYLNSMHAGAGGDPAPQSRDRLYVVFWRSGEHRPDFDAWTRPSVWCPTCGRMVRAVQAWKNAERRRGRYRQQYSWRCPHVTCRNQVLHPATLPAAAAIDWALKGTRIGDKPLKEFFERATPGIAGTKGKGKSLGFHPLAPKTLARIGVGLGKFARPLLVPVEGRDGKAAGCVDRPVRTMTTRNETGLVVPPMLVPAGGTWNDTATAVTDPFRTRTTRDSEALVVPPFITELRGGGSAARLLSDPLATVTASGNHHGLTVPGSWEAWAAIYSYANHSLRPAGDPFPTQTTIVGEAILTGAPAVGALQVDDCLFRMLEPYEAARAMAFPLAYRMLGTKREQMRLAGNAVCPPNARDLLHMLAEALTGTTTVSTGGVELAGVAA